MPKLIKRSNTAAYRQTRRRLVEAFADHCQKTGQLPDWRDLTAGAGLSSGWVYKHLADLPGAGRSKQEQTAISNALKVVYHLNDPADKDQAQIKTDRDRAGQILEVVSRLVG